MNLEQIEQAAQRHAGDIDWPGAAIAYETHVTPSTVVELCALIRKQEAELCSDAQALADANLALMEQTEIAQAANRQAEQDRHEFKNFHRMLCERLGYTHDEVDWKRDQVSLVEFIAQAQAPVAASVDLERIEQYRLQMAAICTAAIGYWKEGDSIMPEYDTLALRDVAKLYAKYAALHDAAPQQHAQLHNSPKSPISMEGYTQASCNYPLCKSEAEQKVIAGEVHSQIYGNAQAALSVWTLSPTMGVMVNDSPRGHARKQFYAVEDVDAILATRQPTPVCATPNQISEVWDSFTARNERWMVEFGYQQFAQALLEKFGIETIEDGEAAPVASTPAAAVPQSAYSYPGWTRCCDKLPDTEDFYEIKLCALRNAEIAEALFKDGKWWTTDGAMSLDGVPPVGHFDFGWREIQAAPQPAAAPKTTGLDSFYLAEDGMTCTHKVGDFKLPIWCKDSDDAYNAMRIISELCYRASLPAAAPVAAAVQGITITELKSIGKALTEKLSTDYLDDPDGESTDYHAGKLGGIMALWREVEQRIAKPPADAAPEGNWPKDFQEVVKGAEDAAHQQGRASGLEEAASILDGLKSATPTLREIFRRQASAIRALNK